MCWILHGRSLLGEANAIAKKPESTSMTSVPVNSAMGVTSEDMRQLSKGEYEALLQKMSQLKAPSSITLAQMGDFSTALLFASTTSSLLVIHLGE